MATTKATKATKATDESTSDTKARFGWYSDDYLALHFVVIASGDVDALAGATKWIAEQTASIQARMDQKALWLMREVANTMQSLEDQARRADAHVASLKAIVASVKAYIATLNDGVAPETHLTDFYSTIKAAKVMSITEIADDIDAFAKSCAKKAA